jgi:chemotaxis signal transduction protein
VTTGSRFEQRVVDLRIAFDEAFARPSVVRADDTEDILLVRVGGDPYALRSGEMSGLATGKKIAPVPSRRSELMGLAGIRGSLVPVYSLAALLGYGAHSSSSPWLALSRGAEPVGLAFQEFEGFVRVPRSDVHSAEDTHARRHVRAVARFGDLTRPIIDVSSALEVLKAQAGGAGPSKKG